MYDRNQFMDHTAQGTLENHKREMEERKLAMLREQRARDLRQLETQLFYKKQEIDRMKSTFDRLKREAVTRQSASRKEQQDVLNTDRQLKDTETRIQQLDQNVMKTLSEVNDKIQKEKAILAEHQKNLDNLEKLKKEAESKKEKEKKTFAESMSRLLFSKKKEESESAKATQLFNANQVQIKGLEQSMKAFTQEVNVLENKIRALRTAALR